MHLRVHHSNFGAGDRPARHRLPSPSLFVGRIGVVLVRCQRNDWRSLGHAIARDAFASGKRAFPSLDQGRRARRAPVVRRRKLERSKLSRSGAFSSAFAMVGTSVISVARCSWIKRNTDAGSKRLTITCFVPQQRARLGPTPAVLHGTAESCASRPPVLDDCNVTLP